MKKKSFLWTLIPAVLVIVIIILISGNFNNYIMTLLNTGLIYFICAAGLSLILGMGGQLIMCSISFMGLGAFLTGQLAVNYGIPTVFALLLGVLLAGVVGIGLGLILMRLQGGFLVFGTIGLVQIGATIFSNFTPLSGGPDGIFGIPKLSIFGYTFQDMRSWFYLLISLTVLVILLVNRIRSTALGRNLMAVRDDETAAYTLGVHVYRTKVIGFTISVLLAAFAGGILALHNGVVSASLFTFNTQTEFIMMVMLGGVDSTIGTLLGTVLVTALPELLRPLANYMNLIYGAAIIVLMIFMPMGITGLVASIWKKILYSQKSRKNTASGG